MRAAQAWLLFWAVAVATVAAAASLQHASGAPRPDLRRTVSRTGAVPRALALRGGFDPLRAVSTPASETVTLDESLRREPIDSNLFEGDVHRLFSGKYEMAAADEQVLGEQYSKVAEDVMLTQQFLVLHNIRIDDQMPGGANCSYADSWFTGALWDKSDDDFQWTRSAWLQCKRAKTWNDMPGVWKRIMRNAWEEFQDFLAMLALPDGGKSTARYREHEAAWAKVQAAYISNVNRQLADKSSGGIAAEVAESKAAARPYMDAKTREMQVKTVFEWVGYKAGHIARQAVGAETQDDVMQRYESTEVQLFGIPLFNTKDPVSERLWAMAQSQGETVTGWPLKAAAWITKKMERAGLISLPPDAPMTCDTHVLLGNTRYHDRYNSGAVDKRRSNALEWLHEFVATRCGRIAARVRPMCSRMWVGVYRQTDRQTDRPTDGQTDRKTESSLPVSGAARGACGR